ncbi:MAG TPA: lyase family protein, partial [Saprospiraceae bacterium]|nr:lyase family protein [Saprospiraceae bacterium]
MLHSISPIDGRYARQTAALQPYFSEAALMQYRCHIEVEYLIALAETGIIPHRQLESPQQEALRAIVSGFTDEDANRIKTIESRINHDVKAIEYFIKEKLEGLGLSDLKEWVHIGLTSQDINNSAFPLMIRGAVASTLIPAINSVRHGISELASQNLEVPMLAYT